MLVLTRKTNQVIYIGDNIRLRVVGINGDQVKIGIEAPRDIQILRDDALTRTKKYESSEKG